MHAFHLCARRGSIALLDDDLDYIKLLRSLLPRDWQLRLYSQPQALIEDLTQETPKWDADVLTQRSIADSGGGASRMVRSVAQYWRSNPQRLVLTTGLVVDYNLGGQMNGIQVLERLQEWPGFKVMLTSVADDALAVRAFNERKLTYFLPKTVPNVSGQLAQILSKLQSTPLYGMEQAWEAGLNEAQRAALRDPATAAALQVFASNQWVEYVTLGRPFSILGREADGTLSALVLERVQDLPIVAELAQESGCTAEEVMAIRTGQKLCNAELRGARRGRYEMEDTQAFGVLRGAFFELSADVADAPPSTF